MSIPLTVENLCNGGAVERFHDALCDVVKNISDPNTEAKKPRKVKLEMTIKPNEHRNMAEVIVSVTSTLQPVKPIETSIMLECNILTGEVGASEMRPSETFGQLSLPDIDEKGKIASLRQQQ